MSIKFHFFGKDCIIDRELKNRENLDQKLREEGFDFKRVLFVNQVHGSDVVVVDDVTKLYGDQGLPKADAIVTNLKNIVIGVVTADCSPILFFDEDKKIVAAAHAGWRGAKLGVISVTIEAMKNLGAKNISAIIGPMIQQDSYEVSQEFFDDFLSDDLANEIFFKSGKEAGKYWFDLNGYVEKKLRLEGINQIRNDKIDTYKNEKDLFSFRRSAHNGQKDCGRNISVICLND